MNLFIYYPKCSTCKKAKQFLDDNSISYTARDIKLDNPSKEEIKNWSVTKNIPIRKFFNTSGILYRELHLKEKLDTMSEEEILSLLASDGMLVKRPLLITDKTIIIGFKEKEYQSIL